jgi:phosphate transporter
MKFGKQLETSANPDWRDYYVQYKRLKRLIKRVAFEVEKQNNKQRKSTTGNLEIHIDETKPLLAATNTSTTINNDDIQVAKMEFWNVIDENLKVVNEFYANKVLALTKSIKDFENVLFDEQNNSHGHVHARSRTYSQDHGFAALQEMYDALVDLRTFVQINHSGFRKIVKKVRFFVVVYLTDILYVFTDIDISTTTD